MRHTHAALLIEQGQHPKVIQSRLGHASITTTPDRYGHLFEGLDVVGGGFVRHNGHLSYIICRLVEPLIIDRRVLITLSNGQ